MSVSRPQIGSFVIPEAEQPNTFRCGVCWGTKLNVFTDVTSEGITTRIVCGSCGNYLEWFTEWQPTASEAENGNDS